MFQPLRNIDEAPSPETIQAVQQAQLRAVPTPAPPPAPGDHSRLLIWIATAVLAGGAVGLRLFSAYLLMELVRVPHGIPDTAAKPETTTKPVIYKPFMLPDEYSYEDVLYALNLSGFWIKAPLPDQIKFLPLAERPPALPALALMLMDTSRPAMPNTTGVMELAHQVLARSVRFMIRQGGGPPAQPWYHIPIFFRELITVQVFAAAAAIALLALFWRTPPRTDGLPATPAPGGKISEDRLIALGAALLMTIDPLLCGFSGLILSETLFIALLTLLLVVVVQPRFGYWQAAAAAGLSILMVYTRTEALLFVAAVLLWRVWQDWPQAREFFRKTAPPGAPSAETNNQSPGSHRIVGLLPLGVVALAALAYLPWLARNAALPDGQWALSSLTGPTLYDSLGPQASGWSNQEGFFKAAQAAGCRNEWQADRYFKDKTWQALGAQPWRLITLLPAKLWATWEPAGSAGGLISGGTKAVIGLWSILLYGLAAMGAWKLWHGGQQKLVLLLLSPALVIALVHSIIVGSVRYRLPAIPGFDLLAAYALLPLLRRPWAGLASLTKPAASKAQRI